MPVNSVLSDLQDLPRPTPLGRCACGVDVDAASFRDRESYFEWWIHPACQACQDRVFLARDESTGAALRLRRGAVAVSRGEESEEFAAVPFLFTVPGGPRAWEARFAVRVGPDLGDSDPYLDLAPMRPHLAHHQIRVQRAARAWQGVSYRLGQPDLVITLDRAMAARIRTDFPRFAGAACVVPLLDSAALHASAGVSRSALERALIDDGPESPPCPSAWPTNPLASCAWIGAALSDSRMVGVSSGALFDAVLAGAASFA